MNYCEVHHAMLWYLHTRNRIRLGVVSRMHVFITYPTVTLLG